MKHILLALVVAFPVWAGDVPASMDAASVPNYTLVRPGLAAAGQPSAETLAHLKDLGFKTVVNLRTEQEGGKDERAAVEAAGLRYVWVPMTADSFSAADADKVAAALDDSASGPVLLHCASSNRVGGVLAVIAHRNGKPLEDAIAEGQKAGLKSPAMIEAVRRVAQPAK